MTNLLYWYYKLRLWYADKECKHYNRNNDMVSYHLALKEWLYFRRKYEECEETISRKQSR